MRNGALSFLVRFRVLSQFFTPLFFLVPAVLPYTDDDRVRFSAPPGDLEVSDDVLQS